MHATPRIAAAVLLIAGLAALPSPEARAEIFGDVYLGAAFTSDSGYDLNGVSVPPALLCVQECSDAISPAGGLRVGYWFDRLPWLGVAGDVSSFVSAWGVQSPISTTAFPVSALVLLRLQLRKTEAIPDGRFQPYVAVGPALVTTFATLKTGSNNPVFNPAVGNLTTLTDTAFDVGVDARLGARVVASDFISFFLEYRYTRASSSWDLGLPGAPAVFDTSLSTSHFNLGLGLHFR